jgi:uncharacterized membrane protein YkoI
MHIIRLASFALLAITTAGVINANAQQVGPVKHDGTPHRTKVETQAALQKEAKMTMSDARAMAQRTVPNAKIQADEIEREGGKLIYSFDMKTAGKTGIDEVNINAMTGKLIANQHETPTAEKVEAKADAKARKSGH